MIITLSYDTIVLDFLLRASWGHSVEINVNIESDKVRLKPKPKPSKRRA